MTQEQQNLVTDNHKLIYHVLYRLFDGDMDYYGTAAIGLCNAAMTYNPNIGVAFSTYACKCIRNEVCKEIQKLERRAPAVYADSLSEVIGDSNTTIGDITPNKENEIGLAELIVFLDGKNTLTDREKQIVKMRMAGYATKDIAVVLGFSKTTILSGLNNARQKIKHAYLEVAV